MNDLNDFASWKDAEPDYRTKRVMYCRGLKNHLPMGSFCLLTSDVVVRLVDLVSDYVRVQVFQKATESAPFEDPMALPLRGLGQDKEVIQTRKMMHISPNVIKDVAFVFHPKRLEAEGLLIHGIVNAFFCRFRVSYEEDAEDGSVEAVKLGQIYAFTTGHPQFTMFDDCLGMRLWRSIVLLQDTFRRMLSSSSQKQGHFVPRRVERLPFSPESWCYLYRRVSGIVDGTKKVVSTPVQLVLAGCSRTTIRRKYKAQQLSFETSAQLDLLIGLLGSFVLFGVRKMKPKIGHVDRLSTNDIFNVVAVRPDNAMDDALTQRSRVELLMSESGQLCITLSYYRYQYVASRATGLPIDCPSDNLVRAIQFFRCPGGLTNDDDSDSSDAEFSMRKLNVGQCFEYNEGIYIIKSLKQTSGEIISRKTHTENNPNDVVFTDVRLVLDAVNVYYE